MWLKNLIKRIFNIPIGIPINPYKKESWSQSGEDIIIEYLFRLRKIDKPVCLDIGAFDPFFANNTYKFFLKGSKIVNIDANPTAINKFNQVRPSDTNLNIGIGGKSGEFDFFVMQDPSLNTFSEVEKSSLVKLGHSLKEIIKIEMVTINQIFEKYFKNGKIDFLSIDAEGVDFEIIQSLDFTNHQPRVICIETINYTPDGTGTKRTDLCNIIENAGYHEYANTNINSIFVHKNWWFGK